MNLEPNAQLGQYQIIREIGRGGMGLVFLGHDTRLGRQVAIKSLPEELAADPNRLSRFEREARTLASLSHPNVAGIYGLESIEGARFLVLEYVEGDTLAERLDLGPLPIDDALEVAVQIARGVEAAHNAGIIHRDLKPANIKVSPENEVKVLDFGLAKASEEHSSSGGSSTELPTVTSPAMHSPTVPGAILGTAPYMSPEQARGRHVDKRTDIWSFGLVLYEMLTGIRPFHGETATDSIGAILHKNIDLDLLPAGTPPIVRHVLSRCMERDKHQRLHDIADARIELERAKTEDPDSFIGAGSRAGSSGGARLAWALAAVFLLAAIAMGALLLRPAAPAKKVRLVSEFAMPHDLELRQDMGPVEFSPDGKQIVFIAQRGADMVLCVRDLSTGEIRVTDGLSQPRFPFWSPNGNWIGFFNGTSLVRINAEGGRPEMLADLSQSSVFMGGGDWREDGTIIFSTMRGPLMRVDERGGQPEIVLDLFPDRAGDWPVCAQFLPDGEHFLVMNQDDQTSDSGLYVCNMEGEIVRRLFNFETMGRFVVPDWVVYWRAGDLHRQRIDMTTFEFIGDSERIAEGVWRDPWPAFSSFSFAPDGLLAYVPQSNQEVESEAILFDRVTKQSKPLGISGSLWGLTYSPSGDRIAYDTTTDTTAGDVAVYDLAREVETILSRDASNESFITWSSDGRSLHFFRGPDLYSVPTNGMRSPELILSTGNGLFPLAETRDGSALMYGEASGGHIDLKLLDLDSGETSEWLATPASEFMGNFSPDGEWVVFTTTQSGESRVVMRSFPEGDIAAPVSRGFGARPVWVGDEIFYRTRESIMSVTVAIGEDGHPVFGEPVVELSARDVRDFDVSPDGTTLLLNRLLGSQRGGTIRLVQNWDL